MKICVCTNTCAESVCTGLCLEMGGNGGGGSPGKLALPPAAFPHSTWLPKDTKPRASRGEDITAGSLETLWGNPLQHFVPGCYHCCSVHSPFNLLGRRKGRRTPCTGTQGWHQLLSIRAPSSPSWVPLSWLSPRGHRQGAWERPSAGRTHVGVSCPWENPGGKSRGPVRACVPFQGTEVSYFGKKSLFWWHCKFCASLRTTFLDPCWWRMTRTWMKAITGPLGNLWSTYYKNNPRISLLQNSVMLTMQNTT